MQGFVHACEQLFLNTGQGAAGQAHRTYLPSFEPDVKESMSASILVLITLESII
jgi:hypothetical protein